MATNVTGFGNSEITLNMWLIAFSLTTFLVIGGNSVVQSNPVAPWISGQIREGSIKGFAWPFTTSTE